MSYSILLKFRKSDETAVEFCSLVTTNIPSSDRHTKAKDDDFISRLGIHASLTDKTFSERRLRRYVMASVCLHDAAPARTRIMTENK